MTNRVKWAYSEEPYYGTVQKQGETRFGFEREHVYLIKWDNQSHVQYHKKYELIFLDAPDIIFKELLEKE